MNLENFEIYMVVSPEKDEPIAEIYFQNEQIAEIFDDEGILKLNLFPCASQDFWQISLDELQLVLETAKAKMLGK